MNKRDKTFLWAHTYEEENNINKSHAVRWCQYKSEYGLDDRYSKWHWTEDANFTLCGISIPLAIDSGGLLPETDDTQSRVDCKRCRKTLDHGSYTK